MIASCVVDTDVISYLYKQDTRAALYRPHLDGKLLIVSFMTIAERYRWTIERNWGARRRQDLEQFLHQFRSLKPAAPDV